jgi:flavin-dependent dehydrogenase
MRHRFCVSLAEHARLEGVEFHFHTKVRKLEVRSGKLIGVVTGAYLGFCVRGIT